MTLINSGGTTLSGASVTISSIPATYKDLRLVVRNFRPATDARSLRLQFNGDANNRYASQGSSSFISNGAFADPELAIFPTADNGTSTGLYIATIYDYANTNTMKVVKCHVSVSQNATTPANINASIDFGIYSQTTAISSITFLGNNSSNITSGTVFLYGVN
jgi:hypothetical protein